MEDRRGIGGGLAVGGIGTVVIALIVMLLGGDPGVVLDQVGGDAAPGSSPPPTAEEEELREFVSVVLAETEDTWRDIFASRGGRYQEPTLVVFSGRVQSACGLAGSAVGPFYCAEDQRVYIDLSFYHDLRERFRAPGDFAQAYVIAHEVGHHIQNLLGSLGEVRQAQVRMSQAEANALSVRLELQADFYAGVWAHHANRKGLLEVGDVDEALGAASAIGDDRLQRESQGTVVPDSFTHGTSAQRVSWFRRGLETGDVSRGDTFAPGAVR